jgi:hypothetical protein
MAQDSEKPVFFFDIDNCVSTRSLLWHNRADSEVALPKEYGNNLLCCNKVLNQTGLDIHRMMAELIRNNIPAPHVEND